MLEINTWKLKLKNAILFITTKKLMSYFSVNLTKHIQYFYAKNYVKTNEINQRSK